MSGTSDTSGLFLSRVVSWSAACPGLRGFWFTGKNNQFPFWEFYRAFVEFPRKSQYCESETIPRITTWEFTIPYMEIYYSQYWKMFQYWEFNCLRLALKIWEWPNLYLGFFQFKFRGTWFLQRKLNVLGQDTFMTIFLWWNQTRLAGIRTVFIVSVT